MEFLIEFHAPVNEYCTFLADILLHCTTVMQGIVDVYCRSTQGNLSPFSTMDGISGEAPLGNAIHLVLLFAGTGSVLNMRSFASA